MPRSSGGCRRTARPDRRGRVQARRPRTPLSRKYISDAFAARREELKAELDAEGIKGPQLESLLENRDEYTAGWSRCSNPTKVASTTRAAARPACSSSRS